jgi:hypothetical protein
MAEPPATIAQTFEFAEGFQLHRLVEPARFHCVRCRQDKTAIRIATVGGNWAQTICGGCLYALRKGKKAKKAAKKAAEAALKAAIAAVQAEQRRIDRLPDDLALELIDACLRASRRIRLERQLAYERPVFLECDFGELTLLPITGSETRLLMPFRLSKGTATLKGELVLGDRDPLSLLIGKDVGDQDAITAWTCALLGFADATCIELQQAGRREPTTPRHPSSSTCHHRPSTGILPRRRSWPKRLEPVGDLVHYSGSLVAGHRRRLHDGYTASDEARGWARQVGIILKPDETWVRPHARGIPDDIEVRFLWHTPTELKLSYAPPTSRHETPSPP